MYGADRGCDVGPLMTSYIVSGLELWELLNALGAEVICEPGGGS